MLEPESSSEREGTQNELRLTCVVEVGKVVIVAADLVIDVVVYLLRWCTTTGDHPSPHAAAQQRAACATVHSLLRQHRHQCDLYLHWKPKDIEPIATEQAKLPLMKRMSMTAGAHTHLDGVDLDLLLRHGCWWWRDAGRE